MKNKKPELKTEKAKKTNIPSTTKSKKKDDLVEIEKEYTIPLRKKCRVVPRHKKTPKAVKTIKEFLVRHMKIYDRDLNKIKIDRYLNEFLWFKGIKNPPPKVKIKAIKKGEIVNVELAEFPHKLKFKKLREEKREAKGAEVAKKKKAEKEVEEVKQEKTEEEKKEEEEKSKEVQEKKAAVVEAGKKMEKDAAKQMRHQTGGKTKQPKRQIRKALEK